MKYFIKRFFILCSLIIVIGNFYSISVKAIDPGGTTPGAAGKGGIHSEGYYVCIYKEGNDGSLQGTGGNVDVQGVSTDQMTAQWSKYFVNKDWVEEISASCMTSSGFYVWNRSDMTSASQKLVTTGLKGGTRVPRLIPSNIKQYYKTGNEGHSLIDNYEVTSVLRDIKTPDEAKDKVAGYKVEGFEQDILAVLMDRGISVKWFGAYMNKPSEPGLSWVRYAQLLMSTYALSGWNSSDGELVKYYAENQNKNGSKKFIVIAIVPVVAMKNSTSGYNVYTAQSYYNTMFKTTISNKSFTHTSTFKDMSAWKNTSSTYSLDYFKKDATGWINKLGKPRGFEPSLKGSQTIWWPIYFSSDGTFKAGEGYTQTKWRYMAEPTGLNGANGGNSGYTFIASRIEGGVVNGSAGIHIKTTPKGKPITSSGTVEATSRITFPSTAAQVASVEAAYNEGAVSEIDDENAKGTITLKFERAGLENMTDTTSNAIDADVIWDKNLSGAQISKNVNGNTTELIVSNVKKEDMIRILKSENILTLQDIGLLPNDGATAFKSIYNVSGTIKVGSVIFNLTAKGTTVVNSSTAQDYASWYKDDSVKMRYYSYPVTGNAEIKSMDWGNNTEKYEAMAGIPTTQNVYVGYGSAEYVTQLEAVMKNSTNNVRTVTWRYHTDGNKYVGDNEKCSTSCPGHYHTEYDAFGVGHQVSDPCPGGGRCGGGWNDGSNKCKTHHKLNQAHPQYKQYVMTLRQVVQDCPYIEITGMKIWNLAQCKWYLSEEAKNTYEGGANNVGEGTINTSTGQSVITLANGYKGYYGQEGYTSGNGRMYFSWSPDGSSSGHWGDVTFDKTTSKGGWIFRTDWEGECREEAKNWANSFLDVSMSATVISDNFAVTTSGGDQTLVAHEYSTRDGNVAGGQRFAGGTQTITATFTFDEIPEYDDLWTNNPNCAAKWSEDEIHRTGYNGQYSNIAGKYSNNPIGTSGTGNEVISRWASRSQPNRTVVTRARSWGNGYDSSNPMIVKDINIKDSVTGTYPKWSWSSASVSPVSNGLKETGKAVAVWKQVLDYRGAKGNIGITGTGPWLGCDGVGSMVEQELGYTDGQQSVNDVVIHNPVSSSKATVIKNDSKYDKRTQESIDENPSSSGLASGCPGNATCTYSHLECTRQGVTVDGVVQHYSYHSAQCYKHTTKFNHADILNFHECKDTSSTYYIYNYDNKEDKDIDPNEKDKEKEDNTSKCVSYLTSSASPETYTFTLNGGESYTVDAGKFIRQEVTVNDGDVWYFVRHKETYTGRYDGITYSRYVYHMTKDLHTCSECGAPLSSDSYSVLGEQSFTKEDCCKQNGHHLDMNAHRCTDNCYNVDYSVCVCNEPHHIKKNAEVWDENDQSNHYAFGNDTCWKACNNDANHKAGTGTIIDGAGNSIDLADVFINIDREFKIYYPNIGDFQGNGALGIANCTNIPGKGYFNSMDTSPWTRGKYVTFPVNVIGPDGNMYLAGEPIGLADTSKMPLSKNESGFDIPDTWTFYAVLANHEGASVSTEFTAVATNAVEESSCSSGNYVNSSDHFYVEGVGEWDNKERSGSEFYANHTGDKLQPIDVVGYIGNLTINDTTDFRFAEYFKQKSNDDRWLIDGILHQVDSTLCERVVADPKDVRYEVRDPDRNWNSQYSSTEWDNGEGKKGIASGSSGTLPLRAELNPITSLRNQEARPGYNLLMDVETVGDYLSTNYVTSEGGGVNHADISNRDKWYNYIQVTPRYWLLDKNTKEYTPLDCHMWYAKQWRQIVDWDRKNNTNEAEPLKVTDFNLYLNWQEEMLRRNYVIPSVFQNPTNPIYCESIGTQEVRDYLSSDGEYNPEDDPNGLLAGLDLAYNIAIPSGYQTLCGTSSRLYLNDQFRTFIGSEYTYNVDKNPGVRLDHREFELGAQRYHFTEGLPSSVVFVESGKTCTQAEIDKIMKKNDAVILCTLDIKARGTVWDLEYDGSTINSNLYPFGPDGGKYDPPKEDDGTPVKDPIVAIYDNKETSSNDVMTEGTH